jgi:hypothetical protein
MPSGKKLFEYSRKCFGFNEFLANFSGTAKFKQIATSLIVLKVISGLSIGFNSLNEFAKGCKGFISRHTIVNRLSDPNISRHTRRFIMAMLKKMLRAKMLNLTGVKNKIIACVDGCEVYRKKYSLEEFIKLARTGYFDIHCQVAVHYKKDNANNDIDYIEIYHRIVVITIISDRGAIPISWGYQLSDAGEKWHKWAIAGADLTKIPTIESATEHDKVKQQGELTILKELLTNLVTDYGKLPFNVLVGDGLYDKATILELCERHHVDLVSVMKSDRRNLKQEAKEDFTTTPPSKTWKTNKTEYFGWEKSYLDKNLTTKNKKVKVIRVIRETIKEISVDNYFYCSDKSYITPRFVEECRYNRWKEENAFNAWTNKWKVFKHEFHHSFVVADAMIGLFFVTIILITNYVYGNLKRGSHQFRDSLKMLFHYFTQTIVYKNKQQLLRFHKELTN